MIRMIAIGLVASVAATAGLSKATAAQVCAEQPSATLFHCSLEGSSRAVSVCHGGDGLVFYQYGKPGREPELVLTRSRAEVDYQPWNGVGRYLWDSLTLENKGYRYQVVYSVDRNVGTEEGFLNVFEPGADEPVVAKACRAGTVESALEALIE